MFLFTVYRFLFSRFCVLNSQLLNTEEGAEGGDTSRSVNASQREEGPMIVITNEIRLQAHHPFGPQVLEVRNCRRTLLPDPSVLLGAALS